MLSAAKAAACLVSIADAAQDFGMLTKDMSVASALVGADINQNAEAD